MHEALLSASHHISAALSALDSVDAPADIGGYLDLGLTRIQEELRERNSNAVRVDPFEVAAKPR